MHAWIPDNWESDYPGSRYELTTSQLPMERHPIPWRLRHIISVKQADRVGVSIRKFQISM